MGDSSPLPESASSDVCGHGRLDEHRPERDAICLAGVSYRYSAPAGDRRSATLALEDVTLHVEEGCNLGIIGPNGGGKTTLVQIVLGLLVPTAGHVSILGESPESVCRRGDVIGYVPQRSATEPRFPVTAEQVVRMGLTGSAGLFRRPSRAAVAHARYMMERVGADAYASEPFGALSGGQQQRTLIARALAPRPRILILDEPLVGIDEAGQRRFARLIHELHRDLGLTVVIVSHDIQAIAAGCNRVACLKRSVHYHDAPEGLTEEVLREVFEHEIAPVTGGSGGGD